MRSADSDILVIKILKGNPDGHPVTYSNFKLIHSHMTFPNLPDNSILTEYGFYKFKYIEKPSAETVGQFQNVFKGPYVFNTELDTWTDSYIIRPFTSTEIYTARQEELSE